MRRLAIFSFYDERGIVDDYIVVFLRELLKHVEGIQFYSNGALTKDSEIKLRKIIDSVTIRENKEFDVGAYKQGLEDLGYDHLGGYDELLLVNHTCFGPLFPFVEMFAEMEKRECDFWGVTSHAEMIPNPFTHTGVLPAHINSNFIAIRKTMLRAQSFKHYWRSMPNILTYEDTILKHESRFTKYFTDLGYRAECYADINKYGTHYPAMLSIDELVIDRNPLLKRRAFFNDPAHGDRYAADLPRALRLLKESSPYDHSLIWKNILRSSELRVLNANAGLTSVFGDIAEGREITKNYGRIAVCAHVFYSEMIYELLDFTDNIDYTYDFIATTDTEEKKARIEAALAGRKNIGKAIVLIVEQNRGRDMSALFIACRELFIDDSYDLVCRLHTKKTPQVSPARGNLFKRHMLENLLNSSGYVTNVLDMFSRQPWTGVALPPLVHIGFSAMGHAWFNNYGKASEIAKLLDITVKFDKDTPIAAYGTMFWFRPKALRKLFEHPWKWTDFNAEPNHVDGGLAHVLERLVCYVAQDAGYTTQQILSPNSAGRNYAMLEYKCQKLLSTQNIGDFDDVYKYLAAGGAAINYRLTRTSSVKQSLADFLLALKQSVAFRSPAVFKLLRPVYRVAALRRLRQN